MLYLGSRSFAVVIFSLSVCFTFFFGVLSAPLPGDEAGWSTPSYLDMGPLFWAGRRLLEGSDLYMPSTSFAYPPYTAPLCLVLALFAEPHAKVAITVLNVVSLALLALYCDKTLRREADLGHPWETWKWLILAIVVGNFFTVLVIRSGQTSLLVIAALAWGWHFAHQNRWLLAGSLLPIAAIKPQVAALVFVWLLLDRQFKALGAAALFGIVASLIPVVLTQSVNVFTDWLLIGIPSYQSLPVNQYGGGVFGLPNLLHDLGIDLPTLLPLGLLMAFYLHWRLHLDPMDALAILVAGALLLGLVHPYDLCGLVFLVPAIWRHVHQRSARECTIAVCLLVALLMPRRIIYGILPFAHYREILVFATLMLLIVLVNKARGGPPIAEG